MSNSSKKGDDLDRVLHLKVHNIYPILFTIITFVFSAGAGSALYTSRIERVEEKVTFNNEAIKALNERVDGSNKLLEMVSNRFGLYAENVKGVSTQSAKTKTK